MNTVILYFKSNNSIQDYLPDVVEINGNKVICLEGSIEGWDTTEIGIIVVETLFVKSSRIEDVLRFYLEDEEGNEYSYGDYLPVGLIDLKDQYQKKTIDDLVKENIILKQELANTNAIMLEFMETILN